MNSILIKDEPKVDEPESRELQEYAMRDAGLGKDDLRLLVEWTTPWHEFVTAIRPALSRSHDALAGEANSGLFPYRGLLVACMLEFLLILTAVIVPEKLASMRPFEPGPPPKYDVIYFSKDELPRTEDTGSARSGASGRSGGREGHHATQVIRVARGPSVQEQVVDAPKIRLPHSDDAVANLMAYKSLPAPPPPAAGFEATSRRSELLTAPVPPPADVKREILQAAPTLQAAVVAPAPSALQPEPNPRRTLNSRPDVVPPPVAVPKEVTNLNPKLTLPASSVVAPAPAESELRSDARRGAEDLQKQTVVPPPSQVGAVTERKPSSSLGNMAVVAPPAELSNISSGHRQAGSLGQSKVVPPPAQFSGSAPRSIHGLASGPEAVPPAPSVSGSAVSGDRVRRETALSDQTSVGGPPSTSALNGIVISSRPGAKMGLPTGAAGSLAMSPAGSTTPGIGGTGGGGGISHGAETGSSTTGTGSGAKVTGTGPVANESARNGISPFPGTGGAGKGGTSSPAMPGVSVSGGNKNTITLPSFAGDGQRSPSAAHSSMPKAPEGPGITVVASSRSGGAFNFYGTLKGDKVYTIYIETVIGTAVMQFSDPESATKTYSEDLTAPSAIRADLPADLPKSRLVISCVLDRSGQLRNYRVVERDPGNLAAKVLAALPNWKFQPALRGTQPIEVNAILGFDIDTR